MLVEYFTEEDVKNAIYHSEKILNSVKVFWLNKDLLIKKLKRCIKILADKRSEVEKEILFSSFAKPTKRSDVGLKNHKIQKLKNAIKNSKR